MAGADERRRRTVLRAAVRRPRRRGRAGAAGDPPRPRARRAAAAGRAGAGASWASAAAFDLLTRPRLRAALRGFRPRVVVAWMNRASGHDAARRLGAGWAGSAAITTCATTAIATTWSATRAASSPGCARRAGRAARTRYLPNFVDDFAATPPADRPAAGPPAAARRSAGCTPTRGSTPPSAPCPPPRRGAGDRRRRAGAKPRCAGWRARGRGGAGPFPGLAPRCRRAAAGGRPVRLLRRASSRWATW